MLSLISDLCQILSWALEIKNEEDPIVVLTTWQGEDSSCNACLGLAIRDDSGLQVNFLGCDPLKQEIIDREK